MRFDEYQKEYINTYTEFAEVVRSLLENAFKEIEELPRFQTTQARAKGVKSLRLKLEERGLLTSERIESEIKDLAGVRLIFYNNTDIDRLVRSELIPRLFDVDWKETRVHYPTDENDQQRYQAFHYTVFLKEQNTVLPAHKKFKEMRCEIQIQTILNHAWAETYHDMIYHARSKPGFGTDARRALDKRMKKIMDEYLRPASYEFQKVQNDYERLMQGKALFDLGPIETLEGCGNNNERHEVLSTIAEHVIPNYDDIQSAYPELRRALINTVQAARNTETQPIETRFGNLPGKTSKDVTLAVVNIFNSLRYMDIEATFRSLIEIYKGEEDREARQQIVDVIKHLAKYHLKIWNQAGPYVQTVLANEVERLSQVELHILRPIVLTIWHELLNPEMESSSFSADLLTINSRVLPAHQDIKALRNKAIDGLITVFDGSSTEGEKREVVTALRDATRLPPDRAMPTNEFLQLTLEDTKRITELLTQRAAGQPYELLEHLEHLMLLDYRSARQLTSVEHDESGCKQIAKNIVEAILTFRDLINTDPHYIRYKTLVGFDSVFPSDWESEKFDYSATRQYRMERVALYVDEVSEETAEDWYHLIERCAATKSNDMATFPIFGEFLRQLSLAKPDFAVALAQRENADVAVFLSEILNGLYESDARHKYEELLKNYLDRDAFLAAIAFHCRVVKKDAVGTVEKVLHKAIAVDEVLAVSDCMIFAIEQHDSQELPLVDNVFVPAMNHLVNKQYVQWIRRASYLPQVEKFFHALPSAAADLVLENLLVLNRIDHDAESILTPIAMDRPASVWAFFERRVKDKNDREDRYEAIPYELHSLRTPLAKDVDAAIAALRRWYDATPSMFRFTGGLLMRSVFPTFSDELASCFLRIVVGGADEDYDFVSCLLENYHGETPTHEVIKELIERLPENDPRLGRLYVCLDNIGGAVWGELGMVAAFRKKKEAIVLWQNDSRPKVREFAASYVKAMEQQIASEQRSAEIRKELRLRDYEPESE